MDERTEHPDAPPATRTPAQEDAEIYEHLIRMARECEDLAAREARVSHAKMYGDRATALRAMAAMKYQSAHETAQQPAPVAAGGAGRGERRWGLLHHNGRLEEGIWNTKEEAEERNTHFTWPDRRVVPVLVTVLADDAGAGGAEASKLEDSRCLDFARQENPTDGTGTAGPTGFSMADGSTSGHRVRDGRSAGGGGSASPSPEIVGGDGTEDDEISDAEIAESAELIRRAGQLAVVEDRLAAAESAWAAAEAERDKWMGRAESIAATYASLVTSNALPWLAGMQHIDPKRVAGQIIKDFTGRIHSTSRIPASPWRYLEERIERELAALKPTHAMVRAASDSGTVLREISSARAALAAPAGGAAGEG